MSERQEAAEKWIPEQELAPLMDHIARVVATRYIESFTSIARNTSFNMPDDNCRDR